MIKLLLKQIKRSDLILVLRLIQKVLIPVQHNTVSAVLVPTQLSILKQCVRNHIMIPILNLLMLVPAPCPMRSHRNHHLVVGVLNAKILALLKRVLQHLFPQQALSPISTSVGTTVSRSRNSKGGFAMSPEK